MMRIAAITPRFMPHSLKGRRPARSPHGNKDDSPAAPLFPPPAPLGDFGAGGQNG
jgi:hypothetical protein